jgi:hypothetical protein
VTPELALQKGIRARLIMTTAVTDLVPASSILDRNERPAPDPSIVIGEGQSVDEGDSIARNRVTIYADLHVWKKEVSLAGVKLIAGEIRKAIRGGRLVMDAGFHCVDAYVNSARFLRDPDGETSHGVVTVKAMVEEVD